MKICSKCLVEKSLEDFYTDRSRSDGRTAACKLCRREQLNAWRENNREKARKYSRDWDRKEKVRDPEGHSRRLRNNAIKSKYGLDLATFQEILDKQRGRCPGCDDELVIGGKENKSACVDHDHSCCSGSRSCGRCVRGIVCRDCNTALGHVHDQVSVLEGMIRYLKDPTCS